MNTLADRLRLRRKELKLSQEDLGKRIGVSQSSIGNIESGRNRSATFLPQLADALGVNALWLAEGKGAMLNNGTGLQSNAALMPQDEEAKKILAANEALKAGEISFEEYADLTNSAALPFYDIKASCGTGEPTFEVISHKYFTDKNELIRLGLKPDRTFWCKAAGDSMEPAIKDGDRLLVEQLDGHSLTDILNNKIYLFSWNGELFCKRLIRQMDGSLLVKSDNSEYHRDILITSEQAGQMKLIGRVRQAHTPPNKF
ncbi:helix-turn-helix transcriptional regulator [Chitinibacter fontanus]|uniref:Helix-turn-helix transcriptional regulator n=1 Tax=Chitinibacter fontanus TaxID=1737446 RepID=A0A7D5V8K8_9NEIS|nr:LexA family transcriptional regulator [Chitinibacter fontanus]QLI80815.1 helix-turn-helix transcriptional regulator [Chitinibacter fontanus]